MVFTSREHFRECNDTSGIVMFICDLLKVLEEKKEIDGVMLNLNKEEIILGKDMIRAILYCSENANTFIA